MTIKKTNATSLSAKIPKGVKGTVDVYVVVNGQKSSTWPFTVSFPQGGWAVVDGQALFLSMLTPDRRVWMVPEGSVPFWTWIRGRPLPVAVWLTCIAFVPLFLMGILVGF